MPLNDKLSKDQDQLEKTLIERSNHLPLNDKLSKEQKQLEKILIETYKSETGCMFHYDVNSNKLVS